MTTETINQIRASRDAIRESLRAIRPKDYEGDKFGHENEYCAKGLISGLESLMTDISSLTKAPNKFIKCSNYEERESIASSLKQIHSWLEAEDLEEVSTYIDQLKPIIRNLNVRHSDDRQEEFDKYIDKLQIEASSLIGLIEETKEVKQSGDKIHDEIINIRKESDQIQNEFSTAIEELENKRVSIENILSETDELRTEAQNHIDTDKGHSEEINNILTESKNHESVISGFSKRVIQRETQLEKQETLTEEYISKIDEFTSQRNDLLEEASQLIDSAKLALEYKTAEGLSAAFITKYKELKEDKSAKYWIWSAGVIVAIAVSIGIWIFFEKQVSLETVIGRVSLLPILIGSAWFCAGQYVKHKNLAEDYAYKSVLSKSIVGFSEQLSNKTTKSEEYTHYIKSVLEEIHNDPLRRKNEVKSDLHELLKNLKELKKVPDPIKNLLGEND